MIFCGIGYNKNSISADIAQKKIDSIKHTVTCLQDPTSYQGEKALSAIAGLAIGASALVFVASKFLLPLFGVNIGNIGLLGGLNLTHLLYGAGAVGALTGTAIMASSLARAKEPYQKKNRCTYRGYTLRGPH